jgi:actin-related protein
LCEALFEFACHPYVCLEYDSVLSCYIHESHTALVLDFGWSCMRVVPVIEGRPLVRSMMVNPIGACQLCKELKRYFKSTNKQIRTPFDLPGCEIQPTKSQRSYSRRLILQDIIQSCLTFEKPSPADLGIHQFEYSLPGHEILNVQNEMSYLQSLFVPRASPPGQPKRPCMIEDLWNSINNNSTPADVRRQLCGNIVVSGGFSALPGFSAFLENGAKVRSPYSPRVLPTRHRLVSGANTVWAGGSILGSVDSFPDFCITKQEWQEVGGPVLQSKCL